MEVMIVVLLLIIAVLLTVISDQLFGIKDALTTIDYNQRVDYSDGFASYSLSASLSPSPSLSPSASPSPSSEVPADE